MVLLQAGEVWYFVKHLSSIVASLLQIFALPRIAEFLILHSPPLSGPFSPRLSMICVHPEGLEVGTSPDSPSKSSLGVMIL